MSARAQSRGSGGRVLARTWPCVTGRQSSSDEKPMSSRILEGGGGTYRLSSSRPSRYCLMASSFASTSASLGSSLGTMRQTSSAVSLWAAVKRKGAEERAPTGILVLASQTKNAPSGSLTPSMSRLAVYTERPKSRTSSMTAPANGASTKTASTTLPLGWGTPILSNFSRKPLTRSRTVLFTFGCSSCSWAGAKPRALRELASRAARTSSHMGSSAAAAAPPASAFAAGPRPGRCWNCKPRRWRRVRPASCWRASVRAAAAVVVRLWPALLVPPEAALPVML
mmetsp:Transcript_136737/g.381094  ORF Transcript_136737/g.381094 Transcript_136737/m.381094 type:complete len:282 (-) Transcript_136737:219-1064(-)